MFGGWLAASPMASLVGQLSQSDYESYITRLQGCGTCFVSNPGNAAGTTYLTDTLSAFELMVRQDVFYQ